MRDPLSDDEVRRIARATAREITRRLTTLVLVIGATLLALGILPALAVTGVNAIAPPLGQTANPVVGVLAWVAFILLAAVLVRSWALLRR